MTEEILLEMGEEEEELRKEIYLSLLPEEISLENRTIHLAYKRIKSRPDTEEEDLVMEILTDITEKRELEAQLQEEKNIFETIVRVITNYSDFHSTVLEDKDFCHSINGAGKEYFSRTYRHIHTFKGTFHQFGMLNLVQRLHRLETRLGEEQKKHPLSVEALQRLLSQEELQEWLQEELAVIQTILGDSFFLQKDALLIQRKPTAARGANP